MCARRVKVRTSSKFRGAEARLGLGQGSATAARRPIFDTCAALPDAVLERVGTLLKAPDRGQRAACACSQIGPMPKSGGITRLACAEHDCVSATMCKHSLHCRLVLRRVIPLYELWLRANVIGPKGLLADILTMRTRAQDVLGAAVAVVHFVLRRHAVR